MLFAKTEGLVKKGNAYAWMDLVAAHVKKRVGCGTKILMKRVGNQKILVDLLSTRTPKKVSKTVAAKTLW